MNLSIEISLYPLQDGYKAIISDFLDDINAFLPANKNSFEIRSCNMSTRIFGSYADVIQCFDECMQRSMKKHGKMVFNCKFLQGDARDLKGYD